jgi:valyl-tRNA synthetase
VPPRAVVPARLRAEGYEETGAHLARLGRLAWSEEQSEPVALIPVPGGTVEILGSDQLDLEATSRRVAALRAKLEAEIKRSEGKLANEGFVAKAPAAVVQEERDKLARLHAELEAL